MQQEPLELITNNLELKSVNHIIVHKDKYQRKTMKKLINIIHTQSF